MSLIDTQAELAKARAEVLVELGLQDGDGDGGDDTFKSLTAAARAARKRRASQPLAEAAAAPTRRSARVRGAAAELAGLDADGVPEPAESVEPEEPNFAIAENRKPIGDYYWFRLLDASQSLACARGILTQMRSGLAELYGVGPAADAAFPAPNDTLSGAIPDSTAAVRAHEASPLDLRDQVVVFTGFRDAGLEAAVRANGGYVAPSMSKSVTIVVAKDGDQDTNKVQQAKARGLQLMTRDELELRLQGGVATASTAHTWGGDGSPQRVAPSVCSYDGGARSTAATAARPYAALASLTVREPFHVAKVLPDSVYALEMHPCANPIIAVGASQSGRVGLWCPQRHAALDEEPRDDTACVFHPHRGPIHAIVIPREWPHILLSASTDRTARVLDLDYGVSWEIARHESAGLSAMNACAIGASGALHVVVGTQKGELLGIDARCSSGGVTHAAAFRAAGHDSKVVAVHMHPHTHTLVSAGNDGMLHVWDVRAFSAARKLAACPHGAPITAARFSATGAWLATLAEDNKVRVWRSDAAHAGASPDIVQFHDNFTGRWLADFCIAFDPSCDTTLAIGRMNRHLEVFSIQPGEHELARVADCTSELVTAVPTMNAIHATENVMVSGTASGRMYFWT